MSAVRHGMPGEWAKVKGTVMSLWPLFACSVALGAFGTAAVLGKYQIVFAGVFAALLVTMAILWRHGLRRVESYFKGASGEERVSALLSLLPDGWHIFNDFVAGAHHIDHVVVGATGVYAVETKNWRGRVTAEKNDLLVDGVLPDRSPIVQAQRQAESLKSALRRAGWTGEVTAVVCLASDTFAGSPTVVDGVTVLNALEIDSWLTAKASTLAANDSARLAQLMDTIL